MSMHGLPPGLVNPPSPLREGEDGSGLKQHGWMGPAPGTVILVFIFLAAFVTYYFVNWKMLSFLWKIG
jgi:hypothetical protein